MQWLSQTEGCSSTRLSAGFSSEEEVCKAPLRPLCTSCSMYPRLLASPAFNTRIEHLRLWQVSPALAKAVLQPQSCPPDGPGLALSWQRSGRSAITRPYRGASPAISDVCLRLSPGPLWDKLPSRRAAPFRRGPAPQEPLSPCPKALPSPFPAARGPPAAAGAAGPARGGPAAPPLAPRSLRQWESRLLVGRAPSRQWALPLLGLRAGEAAPCRAGAARCLRGRRERREAGPGQPQPRQGTGRRGPFALAPSLCPRVSAAAVAVRRRLRGAASGGRALRGGREGRRGRRGAAGAQTREPARSVPRGAEGAVSAHKTWRAVRKIHLRAGCLRWAAAAGAGSAGRRRRGQDRGLWPGWAAGLSRGRGALPALPCPGRSRCPSRAIPGCSGCRRRRKRPLGVGISIAPSAAAAPAALRLHLPLPPARAEPAGCAGPNAALGSPSHRPQST